MLAAERRRILIAGCGYVGSALAAELVRDGHDVFGLRRDPRGLPDGVRPVAADLSKPDTLAALPNGIELVVYSAGAADKSEAAYEDAYVRGVSHLIDAIVAREIRVQRMLFTSSTAVYAQDDGSWVDEASPAGASTFSARALLRAEARLAAAPFETSALRLAGIYGPGRTWLVRSVANGEARRDPPHAAVPRYGNRIHREDCAGALKHLLGVRDLLPAYVGVDAAPAPLAEVYEFVAALLGVPAPSPGEDIGNGRAGNKRCSNARLIGTGYTLRVPSYREGYPAIVRAFLEESREGAKQDR